MNRPVINEQSPSKKYSKIFQIILGIDVALTVTIFSIFCWRIDMYRYYGDKWYWDEFKGIFAAYSLLLLASITRVIFGFLIMRNYSRSKVYGYNIPSPICLAFGVAMCIAFNTKMNVRTTEHEYDRQRQWTAELPLAIIVTLLNAVFLFTGVRVLKRGEIDDTTFKLNL